MEKTNEKPTQESLDSSGEKNKGIIKYGEKELKKDFMVGLAQVPMEDIRPPQILLIQKSSDLEDFVDKEGNQPKVGQFFHTGKMEIMDSFECFFLYAAKSKYVSKVKPEEGEKDQFKAVGVLAGDLSTFGYIFRSSALFALSPLYTAVVSQQRPMFSMKVKIETKELSNDKGSWFIPVVRLTGEEEDFEKLQTLCSMAKKYDKTVVDIMPEDEEVEPEVKEDDIPF
jgi:hypothetical protein